MRLLRKATIMFLLVAVATENADAFAPALMTRRRNWFATKNVCPRSLSPSILLRLADGNTSPDDTLTGTSEEVTNGGAQHEEETTKALTLLAKSWSLFKVIHRKVKEKEAEKQPTAVLMMNEKDRPLKNKTSTEPTPVLLSFATSRRKRRHWATWTRSQALRHLSQWAFEVCDADQSGKIDEKAFYAGLLLVHLNLAKYVGVASCFPPNRTQVAELFELADQDQTGLLNKQEFSDAVAVCCARITSRIFIYYTIILMAIPFLVSLAMRLLTPVLHPKIFDGTTRPWMGRILAALEWSVKHFVTLAFFSVIVPSVFTRVDERSRRLVKHRKTPKYWWEQWGRQFVIPKQKDSD